ncbi:ABC transporter permease [Kutzneria sp. 744]|uniref:ABC transporter permease n=1 Tax=Kutzneria sp. (strain 744) TaxID=345341 RepID=UPI0003EEBEA2|nr:ABC transporter permease [Kutzneria sp. 744]EWM10196.1 ABC transporter permease [Kutzneria sp. 744]
MWAIAVKEFNQLRRDRRMLAMIIAIPLLLLVVFGYAASFDVGSVSTIVVGPRAEAMAARLPGLLDVQRTDTGQNRDDAVEALRDGTATAAVVTSADGSTQVLVDGSDLFSARAVAAGASAAHLSVEVLFNPGLTTSVIMVPGLIGIVLVFVGTLATALGVVRERQAGTLEQLAVMPFRAWQVFLGKVVLYFLVAMIDTAIVVTAGIALFGVPFTGAVGTFALGVLLFLFVTLGIGVLISTVSQNQGQAMQLAMMTLLPQVLLSGLLFPIASMAAGVQWISYFLPLTYFIQVSRGVLVKATPIGALWFPLLMLAVLGIAVFGLSVLRFRRDLAPKALR